MNFLKKFWRKIEGDSRYIIIGGFFLLTIFYNLVVVPSVVEEKERKKGDKKATTDLFPKTDLNNSHRFKIYHNIWQTDKGDYYRLIVKARAQKEGILEVYAHSDFGKKQYLGEISALADYQPVRKEFVFGVDDSYQNILIKAKARNEEEKQWYDNQIILEKPEIRRLAIKSERQKNNLQETIYKKAKKKIVFLTKKDKEKFAEKNKKVCFSFRPEERKILGVGAFLDRAGDGGKGKYTLTIEIAGEKGKIEKSRKFSAKNLSVYEKQNQEKEKFFLFDLPIDVERGKEYKVCLRNKNVKVDKKNHLILRKNKEGKMLTVYQLVEEADPDENFLFWEGRLEDLGDKYLFSYDFSGKTEEFFNFYACRNSKLKYSQKKKMVTVDNKKDACLGYKLDFPHDILAMVGKIKLNKMGVDDFVIRYSLDKKHWKDLEIEKDDSDNLAIFSLNNFPSETKKVYILFETKRKSEKSKGVLGVEKLNLRVYLKR